MRALDDVAISSVTEGSSAVFSADRRYRYVLTRYFEPGPAIVWIGLNPSTADHERNDATIRRIIGFSKREGFGRLIMLNLYGFRSTDPRVLLDVDDPVGPSLLEHAGLAFEGAGRVVCAWGAWYWQHRARLVESPLRKLLVRAAADPAKEVFSLGGTQSGEPRHPLYVHRETPMRRWQLTEEDL